MINGIGSKLKILFLLQDVPFPISDGMRWKMFYLLKYLSEKHQCDVISFIDPKHPADITLLHDQLPNVNWLRLVPHLDGLNLKIKMVFSILSGCPASFARYKSCLFNEALQSALSNTNYDVIHYDIINMAQYYVPDIPSVHSPNDATSLCYLRMVSKSESVFMKAKMLLGWVLFRRYEKNNYSKFTKIHLVSSSDVEYLNNLAPGAQVVHIPFGVPAAEPDESRTTFRSAGSPPYLLVLGGANSPGIAAGIEQFVIRCIPSLLLKIPDLRVRIQGRGTVELISQMGIKLDKRVEVSNWVESLNELIRSSSVVVLPDLSGTGIKTRALQALACGAAVVGTSVAFEGIKEFVQNKEHCVIVDSNNEFIEEITKLLANEVYRLEISRSAKTMIHECLSWERLGPLYENLYQDAVNDHKNLTSVIDARVQSF